MKLYFDNIFFSCQEKTIEHYFFCNPCYLCFYLNYCENTWRFSYFAEESIVARKIYYIEYFYFNQPTSRTTCIYGSCRASLGKIRVIKITRRSWQLYQMVTRSRLRTHEGLLYRNMARLGSPPPPKYDEDLKLIFFKWVNSTLIWMNVI